MINILKLLSKAITSNFRMFYFTILFFSCVHEVNAQEPVAKNGKFVTVKGLKIYYEESGEGMTLLILHNFFSSATQYQPLITEFSKYYRVIAIDLPGHGRSDYMDTTDVYLHKKAAEYIIGVLDILRIDSIHVLGASSGGTIALHLATLRPKLIGKMLVIGGHVYYPVEQRQWLSSYGPATGILARLGNSEGLKMHGKTKFSLLEKQFWNFRILYGDPSFTPDVLATITAKTLVIHGDNDKAAPVINALEMHKSIPNAFLWIVPYGGHLPHFTPDNLPDFFRRTLEFLNGNWDEK